MTQNVDFNKIKELRHKIQKLLEQYPELQELQDEIDRELDKCGNNKHNRQAKLQEMMLNKWYEIVEVWGKK